MLHTSAIARCTLLSGARPVASAARQPKVLGAVAPCPLRPKQIPCAPFSHRYFVHLAAPGRDILSTIGRQEYGELSGSSQAVPQVAAAAVLLKAAGWAAGESRLWGHSMRFLVTRCWGSVVHRAWWMYLTGGANTPCGNLAKQIMKG